jgi:hypothetical protein
MSGTGYTRWTADEYLRVAVNALPALESGKSKLEMLKTGMKGGLPRNRWRKESELRHFCAPSLFKTFEKYVAIAMAMSDAERAKHIPAAPVVGELPSEDEATTPSAQREPPTGPISHTPRNADKGRDYKNGVVRWTDHEKARIARMVRYWLDNKIDTRSLGRLFVEAQDLVLPPERRRTVKALMQTNSKATAGHSAERVLREGETSIYLIAHEKFHPEGEYGPAAEERRKREQAEQQERERIERNAGFVPPTTAAEAQALLRGEDPSTITFQIPGEASDPKPTVNRIAEASRAFGDAVMGALELLLKTHTEVLMAELSARISSTSAMTGAAIAAQIEQGLRGTVEGMLNEALGGTTPRADDTEPHQSRKLKVDVVGFEHGAHEQTVAHAFNGNVDLRFIHPDKASTYAPHNNRHVILVTGRVPHSLGNKIKAAKVEPIMVNRTTGHVIHAIEELLRAEGIENHMHA